MRQLRLEDGLDALIDHRGKTPLKLGSSFTEVGVPVVSAIMVKDGRIDFSQCRYISENLAKKWMPVPTQRGDVLMTSEAPLGRVARVPSDDALVLGQRIFALRGRPGVLDSGFLYFALQSHSAQSQLVGRGTGTTVVGIRQSALRDLTINIPEFDDQVAIAAILGALDDKIAATKESGRTAADLSAALFEQACVDKSGVQRISIDELIRTGALLVGDGYRTKRSELDTSGYRIIRAGDLNDGAVDLTSSDFVASKFGEKIGAKAGLQGDVVLTTKGTVGRVATLRDLDQPTVYSPQLCFFRVLDPQVLNRWILRQWFESSDFKQQAAHRMHKTDMAPYINLADIRSLKLRLLSPEVSAPLTSHLQAIDDLVTAGQSENLLLAELRDTLLPALMSGRLRVKDAERQVEDAV